MKFILVFIGGGLGSVSRYAIWKIFNYFDIQFPLATLITNAVSCFILGYFLGIQLKIGISDNFKVLLFVGFCGGFSTFSTFGSETFQMFQSGDYQTAIMYIMLSLLLCWSFILIGMKIA